MKIFAKRGWQVVFPVVVAWLAAALWLTPEGAWAKTPDGKPPSEETVCDVFQGAAFGLCNAFCEAMDCDDPAHKASDTACQAVLENFQNKSGKPEPPCCQDARLLCQVELELCLQGCVGSTRPPLECRAECQAQFQGCIGAVCQFGTP